MDYFPNLSEEDDERIASALRAQADVESSPLIRVVAIGRASEAADVRVELIALEVRAIGAILFWKAYPSVDRMLGDPIISVDDEFRTDYQIISVGGGGTGRVWRGEAHIIPSPSLTTRRFSVEVRAFEGFGDGIPGLAPSGMSQGPWRFEFAIGP